MAGSACQASMARSQQRLLVRPDGVGADGLLELEHQARADRLDDGRGAALLAVGRVVEVAVLDGVDVRDRAAAGHDRHPVGQQLAPDDQDAGRAGPADELVRETGRSRPCRRPGSTPSGGTSRCRRTARDAAKSQNDSAPWRCSRVGDAERVGDDAGHVARGRERADLAAAGRRTSPARPRAAPGRCGRRRPRGMTTTSAMDSRHGSSLEWCSNGPMNTTGRSSGGICVGQAGSGRRARRGCAGRGCR